MRKYQEKFYKYIVASIENLKSLIAAKLDSWTGAAERVKTLEKRISAYKVAREGDRNTHSLFVQQIADQRKFIKDQQITAANIELRQKDIDTREHVISEMEEMLDEWSALWSQLESDLSEKTYELASMKKKFSESSDQRLKSERMARDELEYVRGVLKVTEIALTTERDVTKLLEATLRSRGILPPVAGVERNY